MKIYVLQTLINDSDQDGVLGCYSTLDRVKEKIIKHNSIGQKKLYNVQYRCEEYLQIAVYDIPLKCFGLLNTLIKIPSEQCKFKECQAITHFLKDYQSKGKNLTFNPEIEKIFEEKNC